jgi:hypothetical protein
MGRIQHNEKRFMMIDIQEHLKSTRRTGEIDFLNFKI